MEVNEGIRLNKYISSSGFCSRREADTYITSGKVTVNGKVSSIGTKVYEGDIVTVCGREILPLKERKEHVYIVLNKPVGITCTTERSVTGNIIDYINYRERIFPIGRLDKDSQGIILLTSDGDIVNKILRAGNNHEKQYRVTVDKKITESFLKNMASGVRIFNNVSKKHTKTKPSIVKGIDNFTFSITLTQGLNRQIRRMCEALGYTVTKLIRVRIMNITLKGLDYGKWRYVSKEELTEINAAIKNSVKTEEASKS